MGSESPKKTKFTNSTLSSHHLSNYEIIKEIIKIKKQTSPQKVHYLTLTDKCSYNAVKDRALGCLFGSFIGDSLGSYCEFSKTISEQTIEKGIFASIIFSDENARRWRFCYKSRSVHRRFLTFSPFASRFKLSNPLKIPRRPTIQSHKNNRNVIR